MRAHFGLKTRICSCSPPARKFRSVLGTNMVEKGCGIQRRLAILRRKQLMADAVYGFRQAFNRGFHLALVQPEVAVFYPDGRGVAR